MSESFILKFERINCTALLGQSTERQNSKNPLLLCGSFTELYNNDEARALAGVERDTIWSGMAPSPLIVDKDCLVIANQGRLLMDLSQQRLQTGIKTIRVTQTNKQRKKQRKKQTVLSIPIIPTVLQIANPLPCIPCWFKTETRSGLAAGDLTPLTYLLITPMTSSRLPKNWSFFSQVADGGCGSQP